MGRFPPKCSDPPRENDSFPPQGDYDYWRRMSLPVLEFIAEPRDWRSLEQWAIAHRISKTRLRHVLAWLEQRAEASTVHVERRGETICCWANAEWLSRHTVPPNSRT